MRARFTFEKYGLLNKNEEMMPTRQNRLMLPLIIISSIILISCVDNKTKAVNDVVHNDPQIREKAIKELKARPNAETLQKLVATYHSSEGETRLRAGHALLDITESIKAMSKGKIKDDRKLGAKMTVDGK